MLPDQRLQHVKKSPWEPKAASVSGKTEQNDPPPPPTLSGAATVQAPMSQLRGEAKHSTETPNPSRRALIAGSGVARCQFEPVLPKSEAYLIEEYSKQRWW